MTIPPLRERRGDIPLLIRHFLHQAGTQRRFEPESMERLKIYPWPGNVRQLRNLVTKLAIAAPKGPGFFQPEDVEQILLQWEAASGMPPASEPRPNSLADQERAAVISALEQAGYNISIAARSLGIHRNTLYYKIKKYDIHIQKDIQ